MLPAGDTSTTADRQPLVGGRAVAGPGDHRQRPRRRVPGGAEPRHLRVQLHPALGAPPLCPSLQCAAHATCLDQVLQWLNASRAPSTDQALHTCLFGDPSATHEHRAKDTNVDTLEVITVITFMSGGPRAARWAAGAGGPGGLQALGAAGARGRGDDGRRHRAAVGRAQRVAPPAGHRHRGAGELRR